MGSVQTWAVTHSPVSPFLLPLPLCPLLPQQRSALPDSPLCLAATHLSSLLPAPFSLFHSSLLVPPFSIIISQTVAWWKWPALPQLEQVLGS